MTEKEEQTLLPLWSGVTIQEFSEKNISSLSPSMYPDYGGAGVDISVGVDDLTCSELKAVISYVTYGSDMCALPLLPLEKLKTLKDPCLGPLIRKRKKQDEICKYLQSMRVHMKCRRQFRNEVLFNLEEIPKLIAKKKYEDILLPKSLVKHAKRMPRKIPAPAARWTYKGGCLSICQRTTETPLLLHPTKKKLNNLAVTSLTRKADALSTFEPNLVDQKVVSLRGGRIFQIEEDSATGMCCVRQKKRYHYINLRSLDADVASVESFSMKTKLCDIKISPYVPGELVVVSESGRIYLKNAETRKHIWKLEKLHEHDPFILDGWWGCDFGAHPRSILYSDRLCFSCLDLRMENPTAVSIISSPNPFLLNGEKLTVTKKLNDFQHIVATDYHLLICDERYPQQPMMSWNHMLESLPLYCDVTSYKPSNDSSEFVTILGSQESADIASFRFSSSTSSIQPKSLCQPVHTSSPRDYINAMKLCCEDIDDRVCTRLSLPLIGVCVIPSQEQENFTVLQMTSVGDIFYQDMHPVTADEKTFRVEPGCILPPLDRVPPYIPTFLESSVSDVERNEKQSKKISQVNIKKEDLLKDFHLQTASYLCPLCKPKRDNNYNNNYDVDVCSKCGMHVKFAKRLIECEEKSGVLCGFLPFNELSSQLPTPLQLVDFSRTNDPLSRRFLSVWQDSEIKSEHKTDTQSTYCSLLEDCNATAATVLDGSRFGAAIETKFTQSSTISQYSNISMRNDLWSQESINEEEIVPPSQELTQRTGLYMFKIGSNKKKKMPSSSLGF